MFVKGKNLPADCPSKTEFLLRLFRSGWGLTEGTAYLGKQVKKEHGVVVSPALVTVVRDRFLAEKGKPPIRFNARTGALAMRLVAGPREPDDQSAADESAVLNTLQHMKHAVIGCGSVANARRLLDMLEEKL